MFKSYNIKSAYVPSYSELKVENFWKMIKSTPYYLEYFPDYKPSKLFPREFLFNLLLTIDPELVENKIMECHNDRKVVIKLEDSGFIEIMPDLYEEIFNSAYRPSKSKYSNVTIESRGRAVFLMKKEANLEYKKERRVTKNIFEVEGDSEEKKMD